MQTLWDHRYAQRTQRMGSSAIRELLKLTEKPDIISFGGGMNGLPIAINMAFITLTPPTAIARKEMDTIKASIVAISGICS